MVTIQQGKCEMQQKPLASLSGMQLLVALLFPLMGNQPGSTDVFLSCTYMYLTFSKDQNVAQFEARLM